MGDDVVYSMRCQVVCYSSAVTRMQGGLFTKPEMACALTLMHDPGPRTISPVSPEVFGNVQQITYLISEHNFPTTYNLLH